MSNAMNFYTYSKAMYTEDSYPYTAADGSCSDGSPDSPVRNYRNAQVQSSWDESTIKNALSSQVLSIAVSAGNNHWYYYNSGILNTQHCGSSIDHAVAMVGWGSQDGTDYWIIRNSWGDSWGEGGYIRVATTPSGNGICLAQSTLVTVTMR